MLAAGTALCALSLGTAAAGIASATVSEPTCHGEVIEHLDHGEDGHASASTAHDLGTTLLPGTYEAMAVEIHSSDSGEGEHEESGAPGASGASSEQGFEGHTSSDQGSYPKSSTMTDEDDGHEEEEGSEYWEVRFLDRDGAVVGETMVLLSHHHDPVVDLGTIVLDGAAVKVSLAEVYGEDREDLHHARCLGLTRLPDPTTSTTSTSTTTTSTTSTTVTPASVAPTSAAPTTAAPTTTSTTTSASVAPAVRANTLPVTGADTALLVVAGAASMMLGTGLILGARRREV